MAASQRTTRFASKGLYMYLRYGRFLYISFSYIILTRREGRMECPISTLTPPHSHTHARSPIFRQCYWDSVAHITQGAPQYAHAKRGKRKEEGTQCEREGSRHGLCGCAGSRSRVFPGLQLGTGHSLYF